MGKESHGVILLTAFDNVLTTSDLEFRIGVREMELYCAFPNSQDVRDFLVRKAALDQFNNFALAMGHGIQARRIIAAKFLAALYVFPKNVSGNPNVTLCECVQGRQ